MNHKARNFLIAFLLTCVMAFGATGALAANLSVPGSVVSWGHNYYGQLTVPEGLTGVTAIAAGGYHTLALKNDGTVVAWGSNTSNDYGGYISGQATVPDGLSGMTAIAAGLYHSLALNSDGAVVAWGNNTYGQTSVPAGLSGVTAIAAGGYHTLALKNDGTVVAWGENFYGQSTVPVGLSGVTAIAAGGDYSLALKNDGTVVAWGINNRGQTTLPAGLSGVTAIAAGSFHALALKGDGGVVAWGNNFVGQTAVPAGLSGVTAIAAGLYHSLALRSDGRVAAWGGGGLEQRIPVGLTGVTAIAAGRESNLVITVSVTTDNVTPAVPTGLTATVISENKIDLAWNESTDNIGVTEYLVYRDMSIVANWQSAMLSDTDVSSGITYSYSVAACDATYNCSAASTAVLATTPDNIPPTVPTGLAANVLSASQIDLTWNDSTDNALVTGYNIYRNGIAVGAASGGYYSDIGLSPETSYSYTVAACDAAGNCSAQSPESTATTTASPAITSPAAVSGVAGTTFSYQITANICSESAPCHYDAYNLPPGLTLDYTTGLISGVPLAGGGFTAWVFALPMVGGMGVDKEIVFTFAPPTITSPATASGEVGTAFSYQITSGICTATTPCFYDAYNLPPGLTLNNSTGLISGVPLAGGQFTSLVYALPMVNGIGAEKEVVFSISMPLDDVAPTVPSELLAVIVNTSPKQINLSWAASTDNLGVTSYKVYRTDGFYCAPGQVCVQVMPPLQLIATLGNVLSYSDTGGKLDWYYFAPPTFVYAVQACDAAGNCSALSTPTIAATAMTVPGAPTIGTASAGDARATVTFTPPASNGGSPITSYTVSCTPACAPVSGGASPITVTGLANGTTYTFTVTATNAIGTGPASGVSNSVTPLGAAPSVPMGLTVTAISTSQNYLRWQSSGMNVTQYKIYRTDYCPPGLACAAVVPYPQLIATISGAPPVNSYTDLATGYVNNSAYNVQACNAQGCSAWSQTVYPNFYPNPPAVPTGLSAVAVSATQINLAWTGAVGVSFYRIYRNGALVATSISTSFGDTGLTSGATYSYTVAACVAYEPSINCSAQTAAVTATTLDNVAPTIPSGLSASASSATQINLAWSASTDNLGVTGYRIYRNGAQVGTATGTSYSDTGLTSATTYSYTVRACDAAGNCSEQSTQATATTPDNVPPTVPSGLSASAVSATQINLAWTASTDNVGVTGYRVYRNGVQVGTVTGTSYSDTGLIALTSYSYTVSACDAAGNCSAQSAAITASTLEGVPPTVPTKLTATAFSTTQINLTWRASTDNVGVTGYKVYRNGVQVGTPTGTSYSDTGLTIATSYQYRVAACDAAGNCSAQSSAVTGTTKRK